MNVIPTTAETFEETVEMRKIGIAEVEEEAEIEAEVLMDFVDQVMEEEIGVEEILERVVVLETKMMARKVVTLVLEDIILQVDQI